MRYIEEFFFSGTAADIVMYVLAAAVVWVVWAFGFNRE